MTEKRAIDLIVQAVGGTGKHWPSERRSRGPIDYLPSAARSSRIFSNTAAFSASAS